MKNGNETTPAYLTEVTYASSYNSLLNPLNINYIATVNGFRQSGFRHNFNYLDLGCGDGTTLNTLAVLFPEARFIGIDFNKNHIKIANNTSDARGLTNVEFHEQDFNDIDQLKLPRFDYIVCYGTFSWINHSSQEAICKFICKSLKNNGLFLVHYAAKPGKVQIDPLWNLMRAIPEKEFKNQLDRTRHGIELVQLLKKSGSIFFRQNPLALARANALDTQDPAYVAHEALTDWQSFYYEEIATRMAGIGLAFVASSNPEDSHINISTPASFHKIIRNAEKWGIRETVTDFVMNRGIRTDIFTNGTSHPEKSNDITSIQAIHVGLLNKDYSIQKEHKLSNGIAISFTNPIYQDIANELHKSFVTIGELMQSSQLAQYKKQDIIDAIYMMVAGKQIMPIVRQFTPASLDTTTKKIMASRELEFVLSSKININHPVYIPHSQSGQCLELEPIMALTLYAIVKIGRQTAPQWLYDQLKSTKVFASQAAAHNITDKQLMSLVINQLSYGESIILPTLLRLGLLVAN